jgi:hypothetical protein
MMHIKTTCAKDGCTEKLHGLNSKRCKLCQQLVCLEHLQYNSHRCPKVIYVPYIRKTWLRKYGQNVTTGRYSVICETCGYVSEIPHLIENAGKELESHLDNFPECKEKRKTFLEEFDIDPVLKKTEIKSSIVRDNDRTLWVCSHCRPPRKFTNHDEYLEHHFTHS